ncbi:MAG: hypothetical protein ACLP1X_10260 [Polyangiaceae bacterium]
MRNIGVAIGVVGFALAIAHSGDRRFALVLGFGILASMLVILGAKGMVRRVQAHVASSGIRVGEKTIAARTTIRGAWIEPTSDVPLVHIDRGPRPDLELEVPDEASARALCEVLFGGSTYGMPRFTAGARWAPFFMIGWGQFVAYALLHNNGLSARTLVQLLGLSLAVAGALYLRPRISIGTDGVLISGPPARFVAFTDIESVVTQKERWPPSGMLAITLRDRRAIVLRMKRAEAEAAAERIQEAIDASDHTAEPARLQLRRGGPDVREWLARLRALARRREPYRAVGATADFLWRLLDDPSAGESERAAAAVMLGSEASGEERARLRDVAARVASPRVRVAMEKVASGAEDDDLAAAMAAVEDARA